MPDLPALRSLVLIVVDGLGHANLQDRAGPARPIPPMPGRRLEPVPPTTPGAAPTTPTTDPLPASHGLLRA
ncbi:hypothetical protein BMH30_12995, partial [Leucobacter sp. OLES1]